MGLKRVFNRAGATGVTSADVPVPAGETWLVKSVGILYAASAVAGNRLIRVEAVIGGVVSEGIETGVAVVANDTTLLMFGPGMPDSAAQRPVTDGTIYVPLSEIVMLPTDIIRGRARMDGDPGDVIDVFVNYEAEIVS